MARPWSVCSTTPGGRALPSNPLRGRRQQDWWGLTAVAVSNAPEGLVEDARYVHLPLVGQLGEGDADAQRAPTLGEVMEWVHLAPPIPPLWHRTRSETATVRGLLCLRSRPSRQDVALFRRRQNFPGEEESVNVAIPSLEEIVG